MYEINNFGVVRNIKSKHVIKPWTPKDRKHDQQVYLRVERGGKTKSFHVKGLLYLVHGNASNRHTHARVWLPVVVSKGNQVYYFETCRKAAKFLAPLTNYTAGSLATRFAARVNEIGGWKIVYQR